MRRFVAAAALVALATSMLGACGSDPQDGAAGPANSAGTNSQGSSAQALAFEAPLVGGGNLDFRTLTDTTVALWFWAPT